MKKIIILLAIVVLAVFAEGLSIRFKDSERIVIKDDKSNIEIEVDTGIEEEINDRSNVLKVVDGDTLDVLISGETKRVRVIGIDTPEYVDPRQAKECFGREASERAMELLVDKTVKLEEDSAVSDKDQYGRSLRHIILPDGENFGEVMLREGYAEEKDYGDISKYKEMYLEAEREAKENKRGMWSDLCK